MGGGGEREAAAKQPQRTKNPVGEDGEKKGSSSKEKGKKTPNQKNLRREK